MEHHRHNYGRAYTYKTYKSSVGVILNNYRQIDIFVGIDIRGRCRGGAWPYEINFNFQGVLRETA